MVFACEVAKSCLVAHHADNGDTVARLVCIHSDCPLGGFSERNLVKRLRTILSALLVAGAALVAVPGSADAAPSTCVGTGNLALGRPLTLNGPSITTWFTINLVSTACATDGYTLASATGQVTGNCTSLVGGGGWGSLGHRFTLIGTAPVLVATGGVTAEITMYDGGLTRTCGSGQTSYLVVVEVAKQ